MTSEPDQPALRSAVDGALMRSAAARPGLQSQTPPARKVKVEDVHDFHRGRGDLFFSGFMVVLALFFLAAFFTQTGWEDRKLPANMAVYWADQFGLVESSDRPTRLGRILKQGWVAPMLCLMVLVPAAIANFYGSWRAYRWRHRFRLPTDARYEIGQWLRALEFVLWFIVYTALVPVLGYLVATLILGTALPWRLGYRGPRWLAICLATSLAIVLVFRTGLQIRTPVNIWLYESFPPATESFLKTWF